MTNASQDEVAAVGFSEALKSWVMVALTLGFVVLYGLALIGKLKPLADTSVVARIEPIIFVIIGYYFGRLPAQQNELTLKKEIGRQTQKADAAQHAKEQALLSREVIEEKLKNVNSALTLSTGKAGGSAEWAKSELSNEGRFVVTRDTALKILNS